jgi:tetratricopeptide (TPR) repeat protein
MTPKVWVRLTVFVASGVLLLFPAHGQSKGGATPPPSTGTGNTGNATTNTNRTSPTTTTNSNTTNPTPSSSVPQPIFVSGRVALEDGSTLPEPVVIETVCNGTPHGEGYTDTKGYFAIELGSRNNAMIQDASEYDSVRSLNSPLMTSTNTNPLSSTPTFGGGDATGRKYMGCDLQAKLVGFRSQQVSLSGRRPMDDPNVGTILMHRMAPAEEGQTVSLVSLAAPKDAKKAYDKGTDALKKKKFDEAEKNFEKAVEAYPKYATAWYELGMLQAGANKMDMARGYFKKALECDSKFMKPYLQLAVMDMMSKSWQDLAEITDRTVKLDPFSYPQAYFFNSVANYNLHNFDVAEKSALEAERLDTRHQFPRVNYLLGLVAIQRKDYEVASKRLKAYLTMDPKADDAAAVKSQIDAIDKVTASATKQ